MGRLAIKIDVDTYRGTRDGALPLCDMLERAGAPALFLFSMGPDNTGKALRRIFRRGFVKKCLRSNVAGNYGLKTLMYGTLLPAPDIGRRCAEQMRETSRRGFSCGIHSWNHFKWQDYLFDMDFDDVLGEFSKAAAAFCDVFGFSPASCGAPGWQCSPVSLEVQDGFGLKFCSDVRGSRPFMPVMGGRKFSTLQIPSTLPTLDELLGTLTLPEISARYFSEIEKDGNHVLTIHSELEGMAYAEYFSGFLEEAKRRGVEFFSLDAWADELLKNPGSIPEAEIQMRPFPGRSGLLAVQLPAPEESAEESD